MKYTCEDRKYIANMIENLKNVEHYTAIFEILAADKNNKYTKTNSAIFLDMNQVSSKTLDKINIYLKEIKQEEKEKKKEKKKVKKIKKDKEYSKETDKKRVHKLSNYEKNILKQQKLKKNLKHEQEYENFSF